MNRGGEAYLNVRDDLRIRAYLLGQLDEAERDSVEERLLGEAAYGELAEAVEAELMDAYVAGELRGFEKGQWETYMAGHPAAGTRLALARGLDRRFGGVRRRGWWWMGGLAAAAVLLVCLWVMQRPGSGPVVVPRPVVFAVALMPGGVRGAEKAQLVRIPAGAEVVKFTWKAPLLETMAIRHIDSGKVVWTGSIWSLVPVDVLVTGDYVATGRNNKGEETADFSFRVER